MIKTNSIKTGDRRAIQQLLYNAMSAVSKNLIIDFREFNEGIQIIYKKDDDLNNIKQHFYNGIHVQLIWSL